MLIPCTCCESRRTAAALALARGPQSPYLLCFPWAQCQPARRRTAGSRYPEGTDDCTGRPRRSAAPGHVRASRHQLAFSPPTPLPPAGGEFYWTLPPTSASTTSPYACALDHNTHFLLLSSVLFNLRAHKGPYRLWLCLPFSGYRGGSAYHPPPTPKAQCLGLFSFFSSSPWLCICFLKFSPYCLFLLVHIYFFIVHILIWTYKLKHINVLIFSNFYLGRREREHKRGGGSERGRRLPDLLFGWIPGPEIIT